MGVCVRVFDFFYHICDETSLSQSVSDHSIDAGCNPSSGSGSY